MEITEHPWDEVAADAPTPDHVAYLITDRTSVDVWVKPGAGLSVLTDVLRRIDAVTHEPGGLWYERSDGRWQAWLRFTTDAETAIYDQLAGLGLDD